MFYDIYYFNDYLLFSIQKIFFHSSDPILQKPDWNHLLSTCRNPVVLWVFFQISIVNVFASFCFGKRISRIVLLNPEIYESALINLRISGS